MRKFINKNLPLFVTSFLNMFIIYTLLLILPTIFFLISSSFTTINENIQYNIVFTICIIVYSLFARINKNIEFTKFEQNKINIIKLFFIIIIFVFSKIAIINVITIPLNYLTEKYFNFTVINPTGFITKEDFDFNIFIGTVLIGPIFEEIIFRGFSLSLLKKYGNEFAIFLSAIAFGLMHIAFPQVLYAFIGGLVYGYIALKYGLKYSIIFHISNNLISYATYLLKLICSPNIIYVCSFICLIIAIIYLFKKHYKNFKISTFLQPHYNIKQYLFCLCEPFTILTFCMFVSLFLENGK